MKKIIVALVVALAWPLLYLFSQVVVSFAGAIVYGLSLGFDLAGSGVMPDFDTMISSFQNDFIQWISLYSCLLTCIIVIIAARSNGRRVRDTLNIRTVGPVSVIVLLLAGVALNVFTVYVMELLPIPEWMLAQYEQVINEQTLGGNKWIALITTALLVPITEELVFRGMSFGALRKGMRLVPAFILQCLLFAGAHMLPLQMLYVVFAAIVLGIVYVWSDSIISPILVHVGYNGYSVIISSFIEFEQTAEVIELTAADLLPAVIVSGAVLAGCLWFLWRRRTSRRRDIEVAVN